MSNATEAPEAVVLHSIIYLIGLAVVIALILSFLGLV